MQAERHSNFELDAIAIESKRVIDIEEYKILGFQEKPQGEAGWINGGFFVLEPAVLDLIEGDSTTWERQPLE